MFLAGCKPLQFSKCNGNSTRLYQTLPGNSVTVILRWNLNVLAVAQEDSESEESLDSDGS